MLGLFAPLKQLEEEAYRCEPVELDKQQAASEAVAHGAGAHLPPAEEFIDILLEVRNRARAAKDWETGDYIRSRLEELGIKIEDRRDGGVRWKT